MSLGKCFMCQQEKFLNNSSLCFDCFQKENYLKTTTVKNPFSKKMKVTYKGRDLGFITEEDIEKHLSDINN